MKLGKRFILFLIIVFLAVIVESFGLRDRVYRWHYGVSLGVRLNSISVEKLLEEEVYIIVEDLAKEARRRPRNAYFDRITGEILPEIKGQKVDSYATVRKIMEAAPETKLSPVTVELDPALPASFYSNFNQVKGGYYTWFDNGTRGKNIIIAASAINNHILAPGEIFSFNRIVGPRTIEKGYKHAPIIVGGRVIPGIGGGICQVSSTLYNAILKAGLEVVERYPHSKPVYYVPPGRDATVSDYLDFKFRNSSSCFIVVKSWAGGGRIEIQIFSN